MLQSSFAVTAHPRWWIPATIDNPPPGCRRCLHRTEDADTNRERHGGDLGYGKWGPDIGSRLAMGMIDSEQLTRPCLPNLRANSGLPFLVHHEEAVSPPIEGQLPRQQSAQLVGRSEFASVVTRENFCEVKNVLSLRSMPSTLIFKFSIPASLFHPFFSDVVA
jgi:hypothetical protein